MTVCRLNEYPPYRIPEERGLLVLVGPAWLCAMAYYHMLENNPIPLAIAIAGIGESVAVIAHSFDGFHFPLGGEVEI